MSDYAFILEVSNVVARLTDQLAEARQNQSAASAAMAKAEDEYRRAQENAEALVKKLRAVTANLVEYAGDNEQAEENLKAVVSELRAEREAELQARDQRYQALKAAQDREEAALMEDAVNGRR